VCSSDLAKAYVEQSGYVFPVYFDKDLDASETYGVSSIPMTLFIDEHGYFVVYAMGAIDRATLDRGIEMAIEAGARRRYAPLAREQ
jgi:hypothetical protein